MPERRIILLEEDVRLSDALTNMFEAFGDEVVGAAHTFEDAQRLIEDVDPDGFDVAVIDKPHSRSAADSENGNKLVKQLRIKECGALLVGIAGANELDGVDVSVNPLDLTHLRELVGSAYTEPLPEAV